MKYAPYLVPLLLLVILMAGPRRHGWRMGQAVLVTIGGLLLLAVLFSLILFRD